MSEVASFSWDAGRIIHNRVVRAIHEAVEETGVEVRIEERKNWIECNGTAWFTGPGALDLAYRCQSWFEAQGWRGRP